MSDLTWISTHMDFYSSMEIYLGFCTKLLLVPLFIIIIIFRTGMAAERTDEMMTYLVV